MFSGIVETISEIAKVEPAGGVLRIYVERPASFDDLQIGDSIATNGVCLTLEKQTEKLLQFSLGPETLKVTGWTAKTVQGRLVNLERSLRLQDRIHGHLVTGHVDAAGTLSEVTRKGDTQAMTVVFPETLKPLIWPKGSVAINGVSLTVNAVDKNSFTVGLIPETLKRTNLGELRSGDLVNLEADNMARGLVHLVRLQQESL